MTKRSIRSDSTTDKEPARFPNRRAQKHSKADSSDATTDSNGPKIVEKHMSGLNLRDKPNTSTAEVNMEMSAAAGSSGLIWWLLQIARGSTSTSKLGIA
jgi:hypothetical protein